MLSSPEVASYHLQLEKFNLSTDAAESILERRAHCNPLVAHPAVCSMLKAASRCSVAVKAFEHAAGNASGGCSSRPPITAELDALLLLLLHRQAGCIPGH